MKLHSIAMCGFRGFREPTAISLAPGFSIIVGPNGSGKSTVCDAIEFALLGSIRPGSVHKERGEGIHDYLWWRGAGTPAESYVELTLVSEAGEVHRVRRTPTAMLGSLSTSLLKDLVRDGTAILDPLKQLCQTAILRDEDITRLSVDLPETERFGFVRAVHGAEDFSVAEDKAKLVGECLEKHTRQAKQDYAVQRSSVADLAARLSSLRAEAARAADLVEMERTLREVLPSSAETLADLARDAESTLTATRRRMDDLVRLNGELAQLGDRLEAQSQEDLDREVAGLTSLLAVREEEYTRARGELEQVEMSLRTAQGGTPRMAALAQLQEYGSRVGLTDGRCPLCGIEQSLADFTSHLQALRVRIEEHNADLASRAAQAADARAKVEALQTDVKRLRADLDGRTRERADLLAQVAHLSGELQQLGVKPSDDVAQIILAGTEHIETLRNLARTIEVALSTLRASQAADQLADGELELQAAQAKLATLERTLSRLDAAAAATKESIRTIRRVQGELIEEQLAALSPLLTDLFQRLRPHLDWQTVGYNLRGDVRRMLSLEVGEGLNPSFVFSSGQRRATGLAFLLALHLSRSWCGLRSLVLDDPVQHIDDYRALHLTEVLTAIRKSGRQIVCTTEDAALAELMARRLRSQGDSPGEIIQLTYEAGGGSRVSDRRLVPPHPARVLVA